LGKKNTAGHLPGDGLQIEQTLANLLEKSTQPGKHLIDKLETTSGRIIS
jgi:hypothetical protein